LLQPSRNSQNGYQVYQPSDAVRLKFIVAASLEKSSEHPLAKAIVKAAGEKNIELKKVENFESLPGVGVSGNVDGKQIKVQKPKTKNQSPNYQGQF